MAFYAVFLNDQYNFLGKAKRLFLSITLIQSIYCIFQFVGVTPSLSPYFSVTGSFSNPNVSAMQIAATLPLLWDIKKGNSPQRLAALVFLLICLCALWLLECRSAWLGILISCFYIGVMKALSYLKSLKKIFLIISIWLSTLFLSIILICLYYYKKPSADSRLFIWQRSCEMIKIKPILGYGYGLFEKGYNDYQGKYFSASKNLKNYRSLSPVFMAYNDYLEQGVQGGLLGFILYMFVIVSVLKQTRRYGRLSISAGVWCISTMGLFNFTIQAFPVWLLFLFYSASLYATKPHSVYLIVKKSYIIKIIVIVLISVVIWHMRVTFAHIKANELVKALKEQQQHPNIVINKLAEDYFFLKTSSYFLNIYGQLLISYEHYDKAIPVLEQCLHYTSAPDILIQLAYAYMKLGQFSSAESSLLKAYYILPGNLRSRYYLMILYGETRQHAKELEMAREILEIKPKVESEIVHSYKQAAKEIIIKSEIL